MWRIAEKAVLINQTDPVEVAKVNLKRPCSWRRVDINFMHFRYFSSEQTFHSAKCTCATISVHGQTHLSMNCIYAKRGRVYSATITRNATQVSRRSGLAKSIRSILFLPLCLRYLCTHVRSNVRSFELGRRVVDTSDKRTEKNALSARPPPWDALNHPHKYRSSMR